MNNKDTISFCSIHQRIVILSCITHNLSIYNRFSMSHIYNTLPFPQLHTNIHPDGRLKSSCKRIVPHIHTGTQHPPFGLGRLWFQIVALWEYPDAVQFGPESRHPRFKIVLLVVILSNRNHDLCAIMWKIFHTVGSNRQRHQFIAQHHTVTQNDRIMCDGVIDRDGIIDRLMCCCFIVLATLEYDCQHKPGYDDPRKPLHTPR